MYQRVIAAYNHLISPWPSSSSAPPRRHSKPMKQGASGQASVSRATTCSYTSSTTAVPLPPLCPPHCALASSYTVVLGGFWQFLSTA